MVLFKNTVITWGEGCTGHCHATFKWPFQWFSGALLQFSLPDSCLILQVESLSPVKPPVTLGTLTGGQYWALRSNMCREAQTILHLAQQSRDMAENCGNKPGIEIWPKEHFWWSGAAQVCVLVTWSSHKGSNQIKTPLSKNRKWF